MSDVPKINTHVAWAGYDDHRFFGYDLHADLAGNLSVSGLLALAVTGRRLSADECSLLDELAVIVSLADPRIWPSKIARVISAYGSTLPAVAAGTLATHSPMIGPWTAGGGARLLWEIAEIVGDSPQTPQVRDALDGRVSGSGFAMGFGVPARRTDERVLATRRCIERRARQNGRYWRLMEICCEIMKERSVEPNIALTYGAACLDLGLNPEEISILSVALWQAVLFANATEGAKQTPSRLQTIPQSHVRYEGTAPRRSPRAEPAENQKKPKKK